MRAAGYRRVPDDQRFCSGGPVGLIAHPSRSVLAQEINEGGGRYLGSSPFVAKRVGPPLLTDRRFRSMTRKNPDIVLESHHLGPH